MTATASLHSLQLPLPLATCTAIKCCVPVSQVFAIEVFCSVSTRFSSVYVTTVSPPSVVVILSASLACACSVPSVVTYIHLQVISSPCTKYVFSRSSVGTAGTVEIVIDLISLGGLIIASSSTPFRYLILTYNGTPASTPLIASLFSRPRNTTYSSGSSVLTQASGSVLQLTSQASASSHE